MYKFVLAGVLSASVISSAVVAPSSAFTEAEFLAALQADHPAVLETAESVALARAEVISAQLLANPEFGFEHEDPAGSSGQSTWSLSWQLPEPTRRTRIQAARSAVDAAGYQRIQKLLLLRLSMRDTYADWAAAAQRWRLLATWTATAESLLKRERARFENGETSRLLVRRLDLVVSTLRLQAAQAQALSVAARGRASGWVDLPEDATPVLPEPTQAGGATGESPLILAARAELEAANFEREVARVVLRSPEIQLGWQRQQMETAAPEGPLFSVSWSVPLWSRKQGERAIAAAHVSAAEARLKTLQREIGAHFDSADTAWRQLARAYSEAEESAVENPRLLEGAEAAFRLGETTLTDYLETLRAITESELAMLELHVSLLAAQRNLERLGADIPQAQLSHPLPSGVDP